METLPSHNQNDPAITQVTKNFTLRKLVLAYVIAMLLALLVIMGIGTPLASLLNKLWDSSEKAEMLNWYDILKNVGAAWVFFQTSRYFVNKWRSNDSDINLGLTTFDNPFYDPNFISQAMLRDRRLKQAEKDIKSLKAILQKAKTNLEEQKNQNEMILKTLEIFVRHHDNASRLIESATYLASQKEPKFVDEMIYNVLSECMTILYKDRSDKSATLFQVVGEELAIRSYTRIKALSSRRRKFKKGEGFAGYVWETSESVILNSFDAENDKRFSGEFKPQDGFKSIIGVPCKIGDEIVGVLCIQSEYENGFRNEDLRALQFYANCCSLIFLYDKMMTEGGRVQ